MFDALAIGDNDTVRTQFKHLHEKVGELKVFVYDFNGKVSFSTEETAVGKHMGDFLGIGAGKEISTMLENGESFSRSYQVRLEDEPFLAENASIQNEQRCFHCHGRDRKLLGGISVFSSERQVQEGVKTGRKISMLIGLTGLVVIVLFVWIFLIWPLHGQSVHGD